MVVNVCIYPFKSLCILSNSPAYLDAGASQWKPSHPQYIKRRRLLVEYVLEKGLPVYMVNDKGLQDLLHGWNHMMPRLTSK